MTSTCKPYRIASATFIRALLAGVMVAGTCASIPSLAQDVLPLPEKRFEGNVGRTYKDSAPPVFPQPARPAADAPNIVVVILDDVGFGQFGVFGGRVPSPNLDKLAAEGLRFNRFHTAGICSPTRAALLTGRNPHRAGFGNVGELSTGYDGYTGFLPRSTATVAEVLRQHGYATAMFGKNHNTPAWETGPAGPFQHWPTGMGFDYFYGFHGWGTSNWHPVLYENTRPYVLERPPGYHLNPDLANHAIDWARSVKSQDPRQPFFLYFATGATHSPHHAPADWVAKFKGQFDDGWDAYRERDVRQAKVARRRATRHAAHAATGEYSCLGFVVTRAARDRRAADGSLRGVRCLHGSRSRSHARRGTKTARHGEYAGRVPGRR